MNPYVLRMRVLVSIAGLLVLALTTSASFAFTPSGLLEIHHINVLQGDCTLIIGPDGTTFLIDAGNTGKGNNEVVPYLQNKVGLLPADGIDYMLATHNHADHLGGLDEVINAGYDVHDNAWDNGSDYTSGSVADYQAAAATTTAGSVTEIPLGTVIQLGDGATATAVCVDGSVLGGGSVPGAQSDENDRSVAMLIQYKDFDYLTAGDMGGGDDDNACTGRETAQVNIETVLATSLMPGGGANLLTSDGVEILHVNHHGSESSMNSDYMNLLTPAVGVILVGAGQSSTWHHPRIDVVENVLLAQAACVTADPALVLQTEEGAPTGTYTSYEGYCCGDITIKTSGLTNYLVEGTGEVSQGPDERSAAGLPATINVDGGTPDTEPPVVAVVAPDGGENWDAGTSHDITWSATDNVAVTSIDLYYSTTGSGGPFTEIATGETNDGVFPWIVPDDPSTNAYVKVIAFDAATNSDEDVSDGAFTITSVGPAEGLVINEIMQNPLAASDSKGEWFEIYNPGASDVDIDGYTIRDNGSDLHVIDNGGALWVPAGGYVVLGLNAKTSQNGDYIPDYVYDGFVLANGDDEVILENDLGSLVDQVFYTGVSPWPNPEGASMELVDAAQDNNVGSNWAEAVARGGTYDGSKTDLGTPGALNSVSGPSDTEPPVVAVVAPDGGESWEAGTGHDITWTASDNVGVASIDIYYSTTGAGGPFTEISTGESNDGVYPWTVPNDPSTDAYVRVVAFDAATNSAEDVSDGAFTITVTSDTEPPVVAVVAPDGGESWEAGTGHDITWTASDNVGVTSIDIYYSTTGAGGPFTEISTGESNDGVYPWTVPNDPSANAYVRVVAFDAATNSAEDVSDGAFTITSAPVQYVHVHGLTVENVDLGKSFWSGRALVTVHDAGHNPISGVTVTGDWSGAAVQIGDTGVSDGSGVAIIETKKVRSPSGSFCFNVTDLTLSGYTYDSGSDVPQTPPAVCGPSFLLADGTVPRQFELSVRNPFNVNSPISYSTPTWAPVSVSVLDVQGRRIASLVEGEAVGPGVHSIEWDGRDARGNQVASGVYFVLLEAEREWCVNRITLLR
ncbi:lamin tail domain-containing protein [Candidatus Eisenbacteria bacterium]|uniref:Lamin tail domain-containing protein n=1 Tax=Eiseniibacteriota bacterium TaxID=2212470 RepID=A0ABV6YP98_UNCEI